MNELRTVKTIEGGVHEPSTGKVCCPACGWRMGAIGSIEQLRRHIRDIHRVEDEQARKLAAKLGVCAEWLWQEPESRTNGATQ